MVVSRESVIFYIAVTVPLMMLTYGCWWIWEKRASREIKKQLDQSKMDEKVLGAGYHDTTTN
jgi:hypothetical protein